MSAQVQVVYVVLAYFSDGSGKGADTVIAAFNTQERAERFLKIAQAASPMKELAIAEVEVEP